MATEVDSQVEPLPARSTVSSSSSKVSKFGAKSGFVIPKNKLSGSLVPVIRASEKVDVSNILKEEGNKQTQRKTKWGIDMTQDASVKKGRMLAYQIRLEQITEQLKASVLKSESTQKSMQLPAVEPSGSPISQVQDENVDQLDHEKREVIGEILRLNPSYKAPIDYKPLLKEAKVPIPVKVYPEYNFVGLLLGSESNTQKRLEEETGAKIRVYGTNSASKEKCEITRADINEKFIKHEELYVHVSADTYDKVDAAVSLLDLLVTPVSGKPAVSSTQTDNSNISDQEKKELPSSFSIITMGQIGEPVVQSLTTSSQINHLQYQPYPGPWYPVGSAGVPLEPSPGFTNSPLSNNSMRFPPSPVNPPNMAPFFSVRASLGSVPKNSQINGNLPSPHTMQQPFNQAVAFQNTFSIQKPPSPYPARPVNSSSSTPPFPPNQFMPAGALASRPGFPQSQPNPMIPAGSLPNRPLTPSFPPRNPSHGAPFGAPPQPGPNNQITPVSQKPHGFIPQGPVSTLPSQQNLCTPMPNRSSSEIFSAPAVQPPNFMPSSISRPCPVAVTSNLSSSFASAPTSISVQLPVSTPQASLPMVVPVSSVSMHVPTSMVLNSMSPHCLTPGSISGSAPGFSAIGTTTAPLRALKPPFPSSGDFTFQPARAPVAAPVTSPNPNSQLAAHATPQIPATASYTPFAQSNSQVPFGLPHGPPSFRTALQNPAVPFGMVSPPMHHQTVNQFGQSHSPSVPSPSAVGQSSNLANYRPPPRPAHFPNSQNAAASLVPSNPTGPPRFPPTPQASNLQGLTFGRPQTLIPLQKPMAPAAQSRGFLVPNQILGRPGSGPIGNQVYDPFSPTSIRPTPRPSINEQKTDVKSENDAEYDDLMASVGVR